PAHRRGRARPGERGHPVTADRHRRGGPVAAPPGRTRRPTGRPGRKPGSGGSCRAGGAAGVRRAVTMAGPGAQAALVRRYRLLLRCYPAAYRDARGEELLGTLLDDARPGQRIPSVRDAADLVFHGLRRRLRDDATPGLAAGLAVAAPFALALGAGLAGFLLLAGEIRPLG